jgi:RNA polymerase sigma factor (TIGR02999 family)
VFALLLSDLLQVAGGMMKSERPGHTLQATALVNEACVRLMQQDVIQSAGNRRNLFAAANRAMQQILVDHSRNRKTQKRGGNRRRIPIDELLDNFEAENGVSFENLHLALEELGKECPRERELVEHRYFGGFSIEETAGMMGISTATAKRDWTLARARLYASMKRHMDQG